MQSLVIANAAAPFAKLAADLLRAGGPVDDSSDQVAALTALAALLENWADLADVDDDDDARFDDMTAELALAQLAAVRVLDATRPGSYVAGQLRDAAVELRRAADRPVDLVRPR